MSCHPAQCLQWDSPQILRELSQRLGEARLAQCLDLQQPAPPSPQQGQGPEWLQRANIVGINVRQVGSFWKLLAYALSLPQCQRALHLLPIWEPGAGGSLYAPVSWELNPEFFSPELADLGFPSLDEQLQVVVRLLHALGWAVGVDVVPHCDRFSQMVLAYPEYFSWVRRSDSEILQEGQEALAAVQHLIGLPDASWDEPQRLAWLFGPPDQPEERRRRRLQWIVKIAGAGYETLPTTMAPPFRGLALRTDPGSLVADPELPLSWREYRLLNPTPMSRVFGPLTGYRLYEPPDQPQPLPPVWEYFVEHQAAFQARFGFDFMRGDMAHVEAFPERLGWADAAHYHLLRSTKERIQSQAPHFAYLAESFLHGRGSFGYSEELDHLEACRAEVALGDLQSCALQSPEFSARFAQYANWHGQRNCRPCFTVLTSDKDDPRFDGSFQQGNAVRLFLALFLQDWPSYVSAGFEVRGPHLEAAANEAYAKYYLFQEPQGPRATRGLYLWQPAESQFEPVEAVRHLADHYLPQLPQVSTRWLLSPDPCGHNPVLAWTYQGPEEEWIFFCNCSSRPQGQFGLSRRNLLGSEYRSLVSEIDIRLTQAHLLFSGLDPWHYGILKNFRGPA